METPPLAPVDWLRIHLLCLAAWELPGEFQLRLHEGKCTGILPPRLARARLPAAVSAAIAPLPPAIQTALAEVADELAAARRHRQSGTLWVCRAADGTISVEPQLWQPTPDSAPLLPGQRPSRYAGP